MTIYFSCRQNTDTPVLHWAQLEEKAQAAGIVHRKEVCQLKMEIHHFK